MTLPRVMDGAGIVRSVVVVVVTAAIAEPVAMSWATPGEGDLHERASSGVEVVAICPLPRAMLAAPSGEEPTVMLGGISDLFVDAAKDADDSDVVGGRRAWLLTDRGPNGTAVVDGREQRTLAAPSFAPRVLEATIDWDSRHPRRLAVNLTGTLPLRDRSGATVTGRPNGLDNDPLIFDPQGHAAIAPDVDGVDTEGLVRTRGGSFWLAEEYRPSLLAADADGTLPRRLVPAGVTLDGAGMEVRDSLPAVYGQRRDNRGFEALAIAPDESRIFALMQSPLDGTDPAGSRALGNVRLVVVDPIAGRPAAEYLYRLGDPEARGFCQGKAAPDDGKLCAMVALGPTSLLVLEQADGGLARLYLVELSSATDTLGRTTGGDEPPLESLRDLAAAGIMPVAKSLVADLGPALGEMRADVRGRGDADERRPLKLEGLAVADERHVFLVNDDDFGIHEDADDDPPPRTCLWVARLPQTISLTPR